MQLALTFFASAALISSVLSAPQLISFKDGRLGVNFGGYHAGVGIGGLLGGNGGAGGGLYAEAGTPHGQNARAGLGGAVDSDGNPAGGLFAGATAGGNVKAEAGLSGGVNAGKSAGSGYATAQAGDRIASSGLGGESSVEGTSGFKFAGTKSFGGTTGYIEHTDVVHPEEVVVVKPVHKKVHKEYQFDVVNEVIPVKHDVEAKTGIQADVNFKTNVQPLVVEKEVFVKPQPAVVEKHIIRYKPHRHHFRKTAYIGGYIGGEAPQAPIIYKTVQAPAVERRVDVDVASAASAAAAAEAGAHGGSDVAYTKQVTFQRNPTFFADIFNIPIQTLKAVSGFLGNAAGSTSVSVQKTASINADSDISPKHSSSSDAQVSVQTSSSAGKIIDDIFAIPINTLGAVNKFLENNVPARKTVTVEGEEKTRLRGHHARRRANKEIVLEESAQS